MRPIDTSALSVAAQMQLSGLPAQLDAAATSTDDLAAQLFGGGASDDGGATLDLSPGAQGLIGGERDGDADPWAMLGVDRGA